MEYYLYVSCFGSHQYALACARSPSMVLHPEAFVAASVHEVQRADVVIVGSSRVYMRKGDVHTEAVYWLVARIVT